MGVFLRIVRWLPVTLWMAGMFYLSHQSAPLAPAAAEVNPVLAHVVVYAVLAILLYIAIAPPRNAAPKWVPASIAFAVAVLYGFSDEVHRGSTESARTGSTGPSAGYPWRSGWWACSTSLTGRHPLRRPPRK